MGLRPNLKCIKKQRKKNRNVKLRMGLTRWPNSGKAHISQYTPTGGVWSWKVVYGRKKGSNGPMNKIGERSLSTRGHLIEI